MTLFARRVAAAAWLLACAPFTPPLAAQGVPSWSTEARERLMGGPAAAALSAERMALVVGAERLLAAGDAAEALSLLERASLMLHAPDTEMGIVRARMQLGEYRRALAFAAHAAGAHRREAPSATALYAWLLHLGGQRAAAGRELDAALALAPGETALQLARQGLSGPVPEPDASLLTPPLRLAPYGAPGSPAGATLGSAALVGDGGSALVPLALVSEGRPVVLRNGLGQSRTARLRQAWPALGMAWLELDAPLPVPGAPWAAGAQPFAGSPASAVGYAAAGRWPAWPLLQYGFFGSRLPGGDAAAQRLLIDTGPVQPGSPVFDRAGLLAGVAVAVADGGGGAGFIALRALPEALRPQASTAPARAPESLDAIYERALLLSLQVLQAP